jgi:hypothetical protein
MSEYTIGCDPGQSIDPTAFCVVRRIDGGRKPLFHVGHLERVAPQYTVPWCRDPRSPLVAPKGVLRSRRTGADLTGVGRPVADLFQVEGVRPIKVTITAGSEELHDDKTGIYHVAKLVLISTVQTLLHDGRLLIQKELPDAPALRTELEDFRATVTDSGRWTFGARAGQHDDLVLALALACWRANKRRPMQIHPSFIASTARLRRSYLGDPWGGRW